MAISREQSALSFKQIWAQVLSRSLDKHTLVSFKMKGLHNRCVWKIYEKNISELDRDSGDVSARGRGREENIVESHV